MTGFNPYPGSYAPLPGIFGSPPPAPMAMPYPAPWRMPPLPPSGADSVELNHQNRHQKKQQHWAVTFGKEITKTALTIGASMAGFAVGGVPGAMIAGSASSAALSAMDQQWSNGKISWGSVLIDGALGLIPGIVGEKIALTGGKVLTRLTGKNLELAAQGTLKRSVITGMTDGALLGSAGGAATCAYDTYQRTGQVDWKHAGIEAAKGGASGVIGGGLGGGAFSALSRSRLFKKSSPTTTPKPNPASTAPEPKPASVPTPPPAEPSTPAATVEPVKQPVEPASPPVTEGTKPDRVTEQPPEQKTKPAQTAPNKPPSPSASLERPLPPATPVRRVPQQPVRSSSVKSARKPLPLKPSTIQTQRPQIRPQKTGLTHKPASVMEPDVAIPQPPVPLKRQASVRRRRSQTATRPESQTNAKTPKLKPILKDKDFTKAPTGKKVTFKEGVDLITPQKPVPRPSTAPAITTATGGTLADALGPNLTQVRFKQGNTHTCYLLSSLDGILSHPQGRRLLREIKVNEVGNTYQVRFPNFKNKVFSITKADLESRVGAQGDPKIKLIEQAYLHFTQKDKMEFGTASDAISKIFSDTSRPVASPKVREIEFSTRPVQNGQQLVEDRGIMESSRFLGPAEVKARFKAYLGKQASEVSSRNRPANQMDVLTAVGHPTNAESIKIGSLELQKDHYYSVRLGESNRNKVVLVNPKGGRYEFSPEQLLDHFTVTGSRIALD